jgi:hypothetical protein
VVADLLQNASGGVNDSLHHRPRAGLARLSTGDLGDALIIPENELKASESSSYSVPHVHVLSEPSCARGDRWHNSDSAS